MTESLSAVRCFILLLHSTLTPLCTFNFAFKSYFSVWKFIFDQTTNRSTALQALSLQPPPAYHAADQWMESTQPSRCGPLLGQVWSHDDNCSLDGVTVTEQESAEASVTTCYQWSKVHTHTGHMMTTEQLLWQLRRDDSVHWWKTTRYIAQPETKQVPV